jgi:hypothetical protein
VCVCGWLGERIVLPHIRQELVEVAQLHVAYFGEDAVEIGLWIDALPLGASDECVESGIGMRRRRRGRRPTSSSCPGRHV